MKARAPFFVRCARASWSIALVFTAVGCDDARPSAAGQDATPPLAGAERETAAREEIAKDPRVDYLLAPCYRSEYYDVDTSNVPAMLTEMLTRGDRDALRRAREELGAMGAEGIAIVSRVVDQHLNDLDGHAHLRNAVDVCQRSNAPQARDVLLRLAEGPIEAVGVQAATALGKHGFAQDFDTVAAVYDRASLENKNKLLPTFFELDPPRACGLYLDWIERGEWPQEWDNLCQWIATSKDLGVARRARAFTEQLPERYHALLMAPSARLGDEAAIEFLRGELAAPQAWRRELAISALAACGRSDDLAKIAIEEPVPGVRLRAINALDRTSDALKESLRVGALSADETLASTCLNLLIRDGDKAAIDRAIELLAEGRHSSMGLAMTALEPAVQGDPAIAARVLEVLARRCAPERAAPLDERISILESISRIPLEESARLLFGEIASATGVIKGHPARRWLLRLVGNVGEPGQRLALENFELATDPGLRLDLLESISLRPTEFGKRSLIDLIEGERTSPCETLYCADRLVLLGRAAEIAPILKRATLRVDQADARRALQCLLWRAFPGAR